MLLFAKLLCHLTLHSRPQQATVARQAAASNAAAWFQARLSGSSANISTQGAAAPNASGTAPVQSARITDLVKPFLFYLQSLWVIATLQGVDWPSSLLQPMRALTWLFSAGSPQSLSIQCVLSSSARMPVAAQVFLISVLMPVVVMLVLMGLELSVLAVKYCKQHGSAGDLGLASAAISLHGIMRQERHKLIAQAIIVVTLFLPQLMRAVFSLFACVALDQPVAAPFEANAVGSFWVEDMSHQCWQGYHRVLALAAGVPLVTMLCAVLPLAMLILLVRNRGALQNVELRHYAFLFDMYRPGAYYWEVVAVLQIAVMVAIAVFGYSLGTYFGCFVLTAALAVVTSLTVWMRPYVNHVAQSTAARGAACSFFTSYASFCFLPQGTITNQTDVLGVVRLAVGALVLFMNVVFVLSFSWVILSLVDWWSLRNQLGGCCGALKKWQKRMSNKDANAC
jgi:hypothetical protein